MSQAFFNGLSGLMSFSKGLDQVSNNVSNMNTPGFKSKDVFYRNVVGGNGTQVAGESYRDEQGEIRQTGNQTDVAIQGEGYFILRKDGEQYYTRSGQFSFDDDYYLVDPSSGARVAGLDGAGNLVDISIAEHRFLQPELTTEIEFKGNLSIEADSHTIQEIAVFNELGERVVYTIEFSDKTAVVTTETNAQGEEVDTPTGEITWRVEVKDADGAVNGSGILKFNSDGTISEDTTEFEFRPGTADDDADESSPIKLNLSEITGYATGSSSDISAASKDGHQLAGLVSIDIQSDGEIKLNYSNGDDKTIDHLALANFSNMSQLRQVDGSFGSCLFLRDSNFAPFGSDGRSLQLCILAGFGNVASSVKRSTRSTPLTDSESCKV